MTKQAAENGVEVAAQLLARATESENDQCVIHVLGAEITTSSFAMYTFSIAVLIQALALISFSPVADHGKCWTASKMTSLISHRPLPKEATTWIWVHGRCLFHALSPGIPKYIPCWTTLGYYRSHMSRIFICDPQLLPTPAGCESSPCSRS
jgi:hypothetical protein